MSDDNDIELSPGFFDLNNPISNDDDISEIGKLIPDKINIENADNNNGNKNFVIEFFTLLIYNNTTVKPCGCDGGGWSRTSTY
jgi:hypothetical protein